MENSASSFHGAVVSLAIAIGVASSHCIADTLCQQARLDPPDSQVFKNFGSAVALKGDRAFVGAPWDNEHGTESGAVYVYQREETNWTFVGKLFPAFPQQGAQFGRALAVRGDTLIVGVGGYLVEDAPGTGATFVFQYDGRDWIETQILTASDGVWQHGFGRNVRISDDVIAVSAPNDQSQGAFTGAVYVFRHNGSEWYEDQKLIASDASSGWFFGDTGTLALDDDIIVVGASGHPGQPQGEGGIATDGGGAAYVFHYNGEQWIETQILFPDIGGGHLFGQGVAVSGEWLVVGDRATPPKTAFLYRAQNKERTQWALEQHLTTDFGVGSTNYGWTIAIDEKAPLVLVGAPSGSFVAVFRPDEDGVWDQTQILEGDPNPWTNFFGRSISISEGRVLIGANGENQQQGAAYIHLLDPKPADLNCSGIVNVHDLLILVVEEWGRCPSPNDGANACPADLNGDTVVDVFDLLILLANWG